MSSVPPGDGGWPDQPTNPGAPPPPPPPPGGYPPQPGYPTPPPGQWGTPGYGQPWGQSPYGGVPYGQQRPQMRNGLGTAALVLGILAILTSFILLGGLLGILAFIFGIIGIRRAGRGEADNRGMAIAGLVMGVIGLVITVIVVVVVVTSDEVTNYVDCLNEADTQQEIDDCADEFADDLEGIGALTLVGA